jgi:cytochrome oxidase assembly protein ShyY1
VSENTSKYRGWRFLYSPRWLGYYAMLIIFAIACVLLSNWQFARRDEARAEIQRIAHNYDAEPVALKQLAPELNTFSENAMKWHPVTLKGRYLGDPVLIRNRPSDSGVGSDLVQAFQLDTGEVILLNRGWVDVIPEDKHPGSLPIAKTDVETHVTARLRASEPNVPGRSSSGHTAGSLHVPEVARLAGVPDTHLYSALFGMIETEDPAFDHGQLAPKPEKDEGPHFSYALQWLAFIAIAGTGVGFAARQEWRNFNRGSEALQRKEEKLASRKQRRRPTDAEEEDAWIEQRVE